MTEITLKQRIKIQQLKWTITNINERIYKLQHKPGGSIVAINELEGRKKQYCKELNSFAKKNNIVGIWDAE